MNNYRIIKDNITDAIKNIVSSKDYVLSTSLVGSFSESSEISDISDIDTIIIIDTLTNKKFNELINGFKKIETTSLGLKNYNLIINSTFGPLKFDGENNIVFHVMIYDIKGHINHVEESPFTCHSWEKNYPIFGKALKDIYPVICLQYSDLLNSRRGVKSYLDDIQRGIITYRKYKFSSRKVITEKTSYVLDRKHKLEYSFHITFHLLNNLYKIIFQNYNDEKINKLIDFYNDEINNEKDITFFKELYEWKRNNGNQPKNAILKTVNFINSIYDYVDKTIQKSNLTTFYRHQKTILNDGTFLGINRNPSIQPVNVIVDKFKYDIGYHSSLIRSLETIQFYNCKKIIETELLDEIDYGLVEGLTLEKVKEEFPNIIDQWSEGKDPKFPSGENQKDVFKRVEKFFSQFINTNENSLVISHLVLLRMILVYICKIEILAVHRLKIDHLEGFRVYYSMNKIIPNLSQEFRKKIRTQLSNYE